MGPPSALLFTPVWEPPFLHRVGVCPTGTLPNFCSSSTRPRSVRPFWQLSFYRDLGVCICRNGFASPRAWTVVSLPRAKGRISQWLFLLWENRSTVAPVGKKGRDGCLVRSTTQPGMGDVVVVGVSCPSTPWICLVRSLVPPLLSPPQYHLLECFLLSCWGLGGRSPRWVSCFTAGT